MAEDCPVQAYEISENEGIFRVSLRILMDFSRIQRTFYEISRSQMPLGHNLVLHHDLRVICYDF